MPVSLSTDDHKAEQCMSSESLRELNPLARSASYEQRYDLKGYPENTSSKALKKRWRHGVNDVLASLGVCVAKGHESMPFNEVYESSQTLQVRLENGCGIYISAADIVVRCVSRSWTIALRQRLQVSHLFGAFGVPSI